jgi:hypothetical protein
MQICGNFEAIFYDSRDKSFYTLIFLTVCDNGVMTYAEMFRFPNVENFSNEFKM